MKRAGVESRKAIGNNWEEVAAQFLAKNGFEIVERNFYFNHGEIDIVAKENGEIVFVEVKFRRNKNFGGAEEFVTPKKQELIRRTAEGYVIERNCENVPCRFDVIAIDYENGNYKITHYKNAF